ncbi:MAG: hypothetical protein ACPK85_05865 [Methanosarcina sp.]
MVNYKMIFYTGLPAILLSLAYILFGWAGLFECTDLIAASFIIFIVFTVLSGKDE